jgi:hypothetical protein
VSKSSSRTFELCLEVADCAAEAADLLQEYERATEAAGRGTHRDPAAVLRELHAELHALHAAANEVRDEVES